MPNWIANTLTACGNSQRVAQVAEFVKSDRGSFDFNRILPMPEIFAKYDTTNHPNGKGLEVGQPVNPFTKDSPIVTEEMLNEYIDATQQQMLKYGVVGWYDWGCRYWGTKWNACETACEINECEYGSVAVFTFETAWAAPLPVIERLAAIFPDIAFELTYADEDYGYNCGRFNYRDGEQSLSYLPTGGSDEAMELYFETHPNSVDELVKNEKGEWEWKE